MSRPTEQGWPLLVGPRVDQSSTLPNLVSFADPRGERFRSMLYRSFVVFGFEMADSEDLIDMVHELSTVARPCLSPSSLELRIAGRQFRYVVAESSRNVPKVEPAIMPWMTEFQHPNGGDERIAIAVIRIP